jgi:ATP-dependent DNA helicase RecQ
VAVTVEPDGGRRRPSGAPSLHRILRLTTIRHEAVTDAFRSAPYTRSDERAEARTDALFGFDDFRPGQERVVQAAVEGRDTLALMPTGSGKSLTYQLAAMLRPTPTLVLSPLIALMKDQVDSCRPKSRPSRR